jgi:amino acid adenylation domain-containing protein
MSMERPIEDIYPLSPMQQGMLFHTLYAPSSGMYVWQMSCRLVGEFDPPAFRRALAQLVERHTILRTSFLWEEVDEPLQVVDPEVDLPLVEADWSRLSDADRQARLESYLAADLARGFDLGTAPLIRLFLAREGDRSHRLVWSTHMLLLDGWSMSSLIGDLFRHYEPYRQGREPRIERPRRYRDYIAWLLQQDAGEAEELWRRELAGLTAPTPLPEDHGEREGIAPASADLSLSLGEQATAALQGLARGGLLTVNTLVQGAWALLLSRSSGERRVLFGATVSGRPTDLPGVESMVGLFINTLPVAVTVDPAAPLLEWLGALQERHARTRRFEHTPLVQIQGWSEVPRGLPLFHSILVFENYPVAESMRQGVPSLAITDLRLVDFTSSPLTLVVNPGRQVSLVVTYDRMRFDGATISRLLGQLAALLEAMAAAPSSRVGDLGHLTEAERRQVIAEWNDTAMPYPEGAGLHELIAHQAERTPDAPAASYDGRSLTYAELLDRARALAGRLRALGCSPEALVGVAMERSLELVVALLGTLEAGAAYLPLDPEYPPDRLAFMLADARPAVLLTQERLRERLPQTGVPALCLEPAADGLGGAGFPPAAGLGDRSLAYVIYTSGSTGRPKGAGVPHRGIRNRLLWMQDAYRLGPGDTVLQKTPFSFDVSVWEFFWPLLAGARIELARPGGHRDAAYLIERIERGRVTVMHFVPSMLQAFLEEPAVGRCRTLRLVVVSGEALTPELERRFTERLPWVRLENLYGPTEAAVDVTRWSCDGSEPVPIGRPIANTRIHLIDADGQPAGIGAPAELWIAGVNVGRGYLGRPELTAEKFVPDPFGGHPGARAYRTGDLARYRADGAIEYLGRIDHQVKVRGFRIELGEIESALASHPAVREAAVAMRDERGSRRLVAYVVPRPGETVDEAELRAALSERLPEYMVPAAWVTLPALPLTPSGKLDRRALPAPSPAAELGGTEYAAPETPVEQELAGIWQQVLGVEQVGVLDNFFALGGDSIRSIQVLARARERGLDFTLEQLFQRRTVRELARSLEGRTEAPPAATVAIEPFALVREEDRRRLPAGLEDAYPLVQLQGGMLYHNELSPEAGLYHNVATIHLRAPFELDALRAAVAELVERHPVLRTSFELHAYSEPLQLVHRHVEVPVTVRDLRHLPHREQEAEMDLWFEAEKADRFDRTRAPLFRLHLHRRSDDSFEFGMTEHHAIVDGWSVASMLTELFQLYWFRLGRGPAPAPPPTTRFRDFVALEIQSLANEESRRYWEGVLSGADRCALPRLPDPRRPPGVIRRVPMPLPPNQGERSEAVARRAGVPLKALFLAVHLRVLALLTGRRDLVTGIVADGRPETPDSERVLGLFVNTLPLRAGIAPGSWLDLVQQAFAAEQALVRHRRFPLAELQRTHGGERLYEAVFNYVHFHVYQALEGIPGAQSLGSRTFQVTDFVLITNFSRDTSSPEIRLSLEYSSTHLDPLQIEAFGGYYTRALSALLDDSEAPWESAPLLSAAERGQLLTEWNDTRVELPAGSFLDRFAAQAVRTPDAVAATCAAGPGDARLTRLTYSQLDRRSDALAAALRAAGARPETVVALLAERSLDYLSALLALFKSGAAYMPLDPHHPPQRLAQVLERSGALLVLHGEPFAAPLDEAFALGTAARPRSLPLGDLLRAGNPAGRTAASPSTAPSGLAYVIFTSGSTGVPKGAMVKPDGMLNHLWAKVRELDLTAADVVVQNASQSFDISVWQFLAALLVGGRTHVVPDEVAHDPARLLNDVAAEGVTILEIVPSVLAVLLDEAQRGTAPPLPALRWLIPTGEALPPELCRRWLTLYPHVPLLNAYGPTECSDDVTHHRVTTDPGAAPRIPIGRPLLNLRLYVLDRSLHPLPVGVAGELFVGGIGVGRGYLGEPARTAEAFVPDPFAGEPGARLYLTGDLGRWLPDGALEFLGRVDHQVKVRGFRVELGEIEAALAAHPGVRQAVVSPTPWGHLAGYVVPRTGSVMDADALRGFLAARLPDYMVPAVFVEMAELPLTPNGKVDRKALPVPAVTGLPSGAGYVAPRTPVEEVVAGIWADVLDRERVGLTEDFFELGGHSLLATRIVSWVRHAFRIELPLRVLFDAPNVGALAAAIESRMRSGEAPAAAPIERAPRGGALPLSFSQQRLWFIHQLEPDSPAYNIPAAVRLEGDLRPAALAEVLTGVAARHEVLRTSFPSVGGEPVQEVAPAGPVALPVLDLAALPAGMREPESRRIASQEARRPFDLARGPLLRARLLVLGPAEHALLLTVHHIVSDGWSTDVLVRELTTLYRSVTAGVPAALPRLPVQYADFAVWQRRWLQGENLEQLTGYWRRQLAGAPPVLDLALDRPRPAVRTSLGGHVGTTLPAPVANSLAALARRSGVTPFMALEAVFALLLRRWSGAEDLSIGSPISGRHHPGLENLIGFFVNSLVLRNDLSGDPALEELIARVRRTALDAYAHQDLPFEKLVEELQPERQLGQQPFFQVMFELQHVQGAGPQAGGAPRGLAMSQMSFENPTVKFDLALTAFQSAHGLMALLDYSADLFDRSTIERMAEHLANLLRAAIEDPVRRISEIPLLGAAESHQIAAEWEVSGATGEGPAESAVELLARQAALRPDAVALETDGSGAPLTFRDLDRAVARLAARLVRSGVGPEVRVALLAERSPELVVGLLAVLAAGGACVPLDPAHPKARLELQIADAAPTVVLAHRPVLERLGLDLRSVRAVLLDGAAMPVPGEIERPEHRPQPGDLAYLIYTSGTTGRPKAVMVEHGNLAHTLRAAQRAFGFAPDDRMPCLAPASFDIFLFELLLPLLAGGTAVLVDLRPAPDPERLAALLEESTRVHAVPALMRQLAEAARHRGGARYGRLRTVFTGGDAVPPELLDDLRETFPKAQTVVLYGPTEATIICAAHAVPPAGTLRREAWIGRPLDGVRLRLADRDGQPVPAGVPGEIWIAGPGVARGYLHREDLTAERFVTAGGQRFYRSGDLARWLPDGSLAFLGRADQQVKIRGFRVELGEIESLLGEQPAVREAVVLAREDTPGDRRLVAYVCPVEGAGAAPAETIAELRAALADRLPEWMVPAAFVLLDALPLTPHGKVDRRALPAPDLAAGRDFVPPRGPVEEALAAIWAGVLGLERVGARDSFFELGGHSLLATQVASQVRAVLDLELPLRTFFEETTVERLAARIEAARRTGEWAGSPALTRMPRDRALPLSFAQQRLWVLDEMAPGRTEYNIPFAVHLSGRLDTAALDAGLREIVRRHEPLRTSFAVVDGQPVQVIAPPPDPDTRWLPLVDLSGLPQTRRIAEAQRLSRGEAGLPFDLRRGPLLRSMLLRLAEEEHAVLLTMHHIVSDGWSVGVLVREIAALYTAFSRREPSPLPELPVQYADFALWQRHWLEGPRLNAQFSYWMRRLAGLPALELPTERPRPTAQSFRGGHQAFELPASVGQGLRSLAESEGATLFMVLLAAFALLLRRESGQEDVVVGTDVAGRTQYGLENLIGFFINQLVLRVDLSGDPAFRELLGRVREVTLDAYSNQDFPFDRLVTALQADRDLSRTPLFQVKLVLQNAPEETLELPGLRLNPMPSGVLPVKFDLLVNFLDREGALPGDVEYSADLFDAATIERMIGDFRKLLEQIAARPEARLSELLAALAEEERLQIAQHQQEFKQLSRQKLRNVERRAVRLGAE